jgi:hypothetical protein
MRQVAVREREDEVFAGCDMVGGEGLGKCGGPELMLRAPRCCPFPARCQWGKVYVAVKDHVMCISCGSGQLLWSYRVVAVK